MPGLLRASSAELLRGMGPGLMVDEPENPEDFDVVDKLGRGRPSPYRDEFAKQAQKLALLGATDIEIADFFEVSVATIYRWKHSHEDFCEALRVGKDALDDRVERSLYQRAVGYTYESEKLFRFEGKVIRAPIREHVPPETGAAMSWLKNRRREQWQERIEHKHTHQLMSDTEIETKLDELKRQLALDAQQGGTLIEGTAKPSQG